MTVFNVYRHCASTICVWSGGVTAIFMIIDCFLKPYIRNLSQKLIYGWMEIYSLIIIWAQVHPKVPRWIGKYRCNHVNEGLMSLSDDDKRLKGLYIFSLLSVYI